MHESPNVPDYDPADTVLLFPSANAVDLAHYPHAARVRRIVVIDSQWQKASKVAAHPNLQKLPCVMINSVRVLFGGRCYSPRGIAQDILLALPARWHG